MKPLLKIRLYQLLAVAVILGFLQVGPMLFPLHRYAVWVPLSDMVRALSQPATRNQLLPALGVTALEVLTSWAIAIVVGGLIGLVAGASQRTHAALRPYLIAFYSVPVYLVYPVLVTIFGIGFLPVVLASFPAGAIAMVVNTAMGVEAAKRRYRKIAAAERIPRLPAYLRIYVPGAFDSVMGGVRLAFVFSYLGVIVTEYLLGDKGIGALIKTAFEQFETPLILGIILIVTIIAGLCTLALGWLEGTVRSRRAVT